MTENVDKSKTLEGLSRDDYENFKMSVDGDLYWKDKRLRVVRFDFQFWITTSISLISLIIAATVAIPVILALLFPKEEDLSEKQIMQIQEIVKTSSTNPSP